MPQLRKMAARVLKRQLSDFYLTYSTRRSAPAPRFQTSARPTVLFSLWPRASLWAPGKPDNAANSTLDLAAEQERELRQLPSNSNCRGSPRG